MIKDKIVDGINMIFNKHLINILIIILDALATCPSSDNHYLFKFLKDFVFFSLLGSGFLNAPDDGPQVLF